MHPASPNYHTYIIAATGERTVRPERAFCGCCKFDTVQAAFSLFFYLAPTRNSRPVVFTWCPTSTWAWGNGQEDNRKNSVPGSKKGKKGRGKKGDFSPRKGLRGPARPLHPCLLKGRERLLERLSKDVGYDVFIERRGRKEGADTKRAGGRGGDR